MSLGVINHGMSLSVLYIKLLIIYQELLISIPLIYVHSFQLLMVHLNSLLEI